MYKKKRTSSLKSHLADLIFPLLNSLSTYVFIWLKFKRNPSPLSCSTPACSLLELFGKQTNNKMDNFWCNHNGSVMCDKINSHFLVLTIQTNPYSTFNDCLKFFFLNNPLMVSRYNKVDCIWLWHLKFLLPRTASPFPIYFHDLDLLKKLPLTSF